MNPLAPGMTVRALHPGTHHPRGLTGVLTTLDASTGTALVAWADRPLLVFRTWLAHLQPWPPLATDPLEAE